MEPWILIALAVLCLVLCGVNTVMLVVLLSRKSNGASLQKLNQSVGALADEQRRTSDLFLRELSHSREEETKSARLAREELAGGMDLLSQRLVRTLMDMSSQHKLLLDGVSKQFVELTQMNETKLERVRETVERKLSALQEDNGLKLEQMRRTVDEKLNETLEKRLGESFKLVSDRLEQVHKGLGEMQSLASGVGDLKKVLTNVKTRGTLGEIQLETILEQVLTSEQYMKNAAIQAGSMERVDFAVRLPGSGKEEPILLPMDAKFPLEDYQRLLDAEEAGDLQAAAASARELEVRIRQEAKAIQSKYIHPPATTDFALMFLPIEGLFAQVLKKPGLWDSLQREYRVIVTGPTTITALLNSLQMGFRTLAIQERSSEVWQLLGAVKTEFGKFGAILDKTQKKLQEASNTISDASAKSRAIERRLKRVEAIPTSEASAALEEADLDFSSVE